MAKQTRIYWSVDGLKLACTVGKDGKEIFAGNLTDLFEDFMELDSVQQEAITYGMKQKLSDSLARTKDQTLNDSEKAIELAKNWKRITKDREWNAKPKKLNPLEKAERNLAAYEKEVEALVDNMKAAGATDEVIDNLHEKLWEPKLKELQAKVAELS